MHFQKPMLGVPMDWSNPLNKDLVMHLAMNEGYGDAVRDMSMNGNHGIMNNFTFPPTAVSGWNPGQTGVGLNFDGTGDHITCVDSASLKNTNSKGTIGLFVKLSETTSSRSIFYRGDGWFSGNMLLFRKVANFDRVSVMIYSGGVQQMSYSITGLGYENWHQIVLSYNVNDGKVYADGELVHEDTSCAMMTGSTHTVIGSNKFQYDFFTGSIDQVRIHRRALTSKEVQDYYINPWQVYLDEEDM